jgi:hypothetical protein
VTTMPLNLTHRSSGTKTLTARSPTAKGGSPAARWDQGMGNKRAWVAIGRTRA